MTRDAEKFTYSCPQGTLFHGVLSASPRLRPLAAPALSKFHAPFANMDVSVSIPAVFLTHAQLASLQFQVPR